MPAARPVTTPVLVVIDTVNRLPVLQAPPEIASVSVVLAPIHIPVTPLITAGNELIATTAVRTQPEGIEYDIVAVPSATPLTIPVEPPILAMPELLLLHVPPIVPSARAVVEPTHALSTPVIGKIAFIVIVAVAKQPTAIV